MCSVLVLFFQCTLQISLTFFSYRISSSSFLLITQRRLRRWLFYLLLPALLPTLSTPLLPGPQMLHWTQSGAVQAYLPYFIFRIEFFWHFFFLSSLCSSFLYIFLLFFSPALDLHFFFSSFSIFLFFLVCRMQSPRLQSKDMLFHFLLQSFCLWICLVDM